MANIVAFTNSFLSYLLLFGICVAVVIAACIIGVKLRKSKDAKVEAESNKQEDTQE